MSRRPTAAQYRRALMELVDALDRQAPNHLISLRVSEARERARLLLPSKTVLTADMPLLNPRDAGVSR